MILALLLACAGPVERGEAALARDDLPSAEREFRAALDADPADADALYGLGWTFHRAGETGPARDAFSQLVRLHPGLASGHRGLGSVLAAEGDLPGAREKLGAALEREPGDQAAGQSMALVDLAEGDAAAALERIDGLLGAEPDNSELLQTRAAALARLERTEEAMVAAAGGVAAADSPRALAAARLTWVEVMLQHSDDRLDAGACTSAGPLLREWYDAADHVLDQVEASGALRSSARELRREVRRRRGYLEDLCVGGGQ